MDINQAWKSTCKVLLGDEMGDLEKYRKYLLKHVEPVVEKKSSLSGKAVFFSSDEFLPGARFLSYDEISAYGQKFANFSVNVNQIKDIDSLMQAVGEVAYYCGGAVLGNSQEVRDSNRCFDSVNVYHSQEIYGSKHVAFSSIARFAEYLFGSNGIGETKFGIKNYNTYQNNRCFECHLIYNSSDCYLSANIMNCSDCIFCFNLRNRNHSVGNVALPKDKYFRLKEALAEQMRTELESKKELFGILELLGEAGRKRMLQEKKGVAERKPSNPTKELNDAFADTTRLLFGREVAPLADYRQWLYRHVPPLVFFPSPLSSRMVYAEPLKYNLFEGAQGSFVKLDEALKLADMRIEEKNVEKLNLGNAAELLGKIAYTTTEAEVGINVNVVDCAAYGYAINALECWWPVKTKNAAYCGWSRQSENTFGCSLIFSSKFCVKCFNSLNLNRCFEVSDSDSCSDCYFCHNVENCQECMFCFNVKSKRHAIGNVEVGREKYMAIKKLIMSDILERLERDKKLDASIYGVGCTHEKN